MNAVVPFVMSNLVRTGIFRFQMIYCWSMVYIHQKHLRDMFKGIYIVCSLRLQH